MEDWTNETYANAEKDMEKQKQEWEVAQQRHLQDLEKGTAENDEDSDEDEEIVTYLSIDAKNQVKNKSQKQLLNVNSRKASTKRTKALKPTPLSSPPQPIAQTKRTAGRMNGTMVEKENHRKLTITEMVESNIADVITVPTKRKRGRPPKKQGAFFAIKDDVEDITEIVKNSTSNPTVVAKSPTPVNNSIYTSSEVEIVASIPANKRLSHHIPSPNKVVTRRSAGNVPPH